jgi:uncharacterized phiE125 gp8 family phage protein
MRIVSRRLITPPASEPVTLVEAKDYARVIPDADDALVTGLIKAAREQVETILRRALMPQTWSIQLSDFPYGAVKLPLPPFQSITAVRYTDTTGAPKTVPSTTYRVDLDGDYAAFGIDYEAYWPVDSSDRFPIAIEYLAGYANAAAVPESIKIAIKILVAHLYNNREPVVVGTSAQLMPLSVDRLLSGYRVWEFA